MAQEARAFLELYQGYAALIKGDGTVLAANSRLKTFLGLGSDGANWSLLDSLTSPSEGFADIVRRCHNSLQPASGVIALRSAAGQTESCHVQAVAVGQAPRLEDAVIALYANPEQGVQGRFRALNTQMSQLRAEAMRRIKVEKQLHESEKKLGGILGIAPLAIISADADQRITVFNAGAEQMFGYSADEVLGRDLEILMPERAREHHRAHVENFAGTSTPSRMMSERAEIAGLKKDGSEFPASGSISRIEQDGRVVLTVIMRDITEEKRAREALVASEQALQRRFDELEMAHRKLEEQGADLARLAEDLEAARDQANAANAAKSQFLANMSHELRTPLNAIIGFAEIMKDEMMGPVGNARYHGYTEDIFQSGSHLLSIINDILDLSKVESGAETLNEEEFAAETVVQSALTFVGQRGIKAGVNLASEVGGDLPLLRADERKVKQVLVNLLTNAVKFTPRGGKVTIKVWCREDSGFVFEVADTGIGIAPEDIPKAMSPFGQVDSGLSRKYEGTGLGLPLSKSFVELHGGSFDLRSRVGAGTTVTLRFPAARIIVAGRTGEKRLQAAH